MHQSHQLEALEVRLNLAVTAAFLPSSGVLTVFGDNLNNQIDVSRNAAGQILVNGGAVPVTGGTSTVANTALIQVFGQAGNDTISLNEANGALPRALLFGGAGDDVLTGGAGNDTFVIRAGDGNDTITDMALGVARGDVIDFAGVFASFADVMAASSQVGADVLITIDATTHLTLAGHTLAEMHANDFAFA